MGRTRVRTPTVLQMEALECGAACLAMVLGYHGRYVPLEELRIACGVSRDGSKMLNVLKAARSFGLECKAYKKEPEELRTLTFPLIAFWNFNHFVVVEGFAKGQAFLNDPGVGPRRVSDAEFDESFTGVVMAFQKGPEFRKGGKRPTIIGALRKRLPGSRVDIAYVFLATLALVVPGLLLPVFSKVFIDNILIGGSTLWLKPVLLAMAGAALVRALLTYLQQRSLLRLEMKLSLTSSSRFLWHVLRLPVEFFAQRYAGDIASRVAINDGVAVLLSGDLATNLVSIVMVGFYAALMFQYDAVLTLLSIAVALLNLGVLKLLARTRRDGNMRLLQENAKLIGTSMSGLQGVETLKATGTESEFFSKWAGHQAKVVTAEQDLAVPTEYLSAVSPLLVTLNGVAVIGLGGLRVIDGILTMGMLVAFQSLVMSFMMPVSRLVGLGGKLQEAEGSMNRLDDVLHYPQDPFVANADSTSPPAPAQKLDGYLELRNVTFGYSRLEPPLISNFNLSASPGHRVALVGGSGSGKSTIAKLVAGLYRPWEGEILFDGVKRDDLPREVLTSSVALVDQEISLFDGTIAENLTMWDDTVEEPVIVRAAVDACVHDDITDRLGGLRVPRGGTGPELQRRAAAAARDREGAGRQPPGPGPGRGDQCPGPAHRETRGRRHPAPRLHLPGRRPPAEHHPRLRRDRGARARPGCRTRHARGTDGVRGHVRAPHPRHLTARRRGSGLWKDRQTPHP